MKSYQFTSGSEATIAALPLSDSVLNRRLAASTAENIAVPSGAKFVVLTAIGALAWAKPDGTAAANGSDITDGSGSIPLPDGIPRMFRCDGVTNISVLSAAAIDVTAEFFS